MVRDDEGNGEDREPQHHRAPLEDAVDAVVPQPRFARCESGTPELVDPECLNASVVRGRHIDRPRPVVADEHDSVVRVGDLLDGGKLFGADRRPLVQVRRLVPLAGHPLLDTRAQVVGPRRAGAEESEERETDEDHSGTYRDDAGCPRDDDPREAESPGAHHELGRLPFQQSR